MTTTERNPHPKWEEGSTGWHLDLDEGLVRLSVHELNDGAFSSFAWTVSVGEMFDLFYDGTECEDTLVEAQLAAEDALRGWLLSVTKELGGDHG